MFVRLSILRNCSGSCKKLSRDLLEPHKLSTRLGILQRQCSDIKRNEELLFSSHGTGVVIPSAMKIKQTIKSGFYDLVDGFTCVQTSCPTCPSTNVQSDGKDQSKNHDNCLFINKTTGK